MSHRKSQIESTLKRAISELLISRLSDPRIVGMVSITRLKVSPDLHDAYVYVSVLPDHHQQKTLQGLRHAAGHIQSLLLKQVKMRTVPRLNFCMDQSLKKQTAILDAIDQDQQRSRQNPTDIPVGPGYDSVNMAAECPQT